MSSVRPIVETEKLHAEGMPITAFAGFFGLTMGLHKYLQYFEF